MTINLMPVFLSLKFLENLLFRVKLLSKCEAYRYVVLTVVYQHIHYI